MVLVALASIATIGVPRATAAGTASITILVVAEPYDLQDFSYTTTGAGLSSFVLDDDSGIDSTYDSSITFSALNAGTYTVTQAAVPAGTSRPSTAPWGAPTWSTAGPPSC
ncbi:MAG: hypothetical protein ACKO1Y_08815 [Actinomycetota bacterium]